MKRATLVAIALLWTAGCGAKGTTERTDSADPEQAAVESVDTGDSSMGNATSGETPNATTVANLPGVSTAPPATPPGAPVTTGIAATTTPATTTSPGQPVRGGAPPVTQISPTANEDVLPDPPEVSGTPLSVETGMSFGGGVTSTGPLLIAAGPDGDLVVAGAGYDADALGLELESSEDEAYVLRMNSLGEVTHFTHFPGVIGPDALAVDTTGNIVVAGDLYRDSNFGGETLAELAEGYYVVGLDAELEHRFSTSVPTEQTIWRRQMTMDAEGAAYLVGGSYDFNSSRETGFVHKFSPEGDSLWEQLLPGTGSTAAVTDVDVSDSGQLVIAGGFSSTLSVGDEQLVSRAGDSYNGYVAVLDAADGTPGAAYRVGGTVFDLINSVQVLPDGAIRIAGQTSGVADFGGVESNADAEGSPFVAELDANGEGNWVVVLPGDGIAFSADTDELLRTHVTGKFDDPAGQLPTTFFSTVDSSGKLVGELLFVSGGNGGREVVAAPGAGVWLTGEASGVVDYGTGPIDIEHGVYLIHFSAD